MALGHASHQVTLSLAAAWSLRVSVVKAKKGGESIASSATAQDRTQNRRVEVEVSG